MNLSFHLEKSFSCWTHMTPFLMQESDPSKLGPGWTEAEEECSELSVTDGALFMCWTPEIIIFLQIQYYAKEPKFKDLQYNETQMCIHELYSLFHPWGLIQQYPNDVQFIVS